MSRGERIPPPSDPAEAAAWFRDQETLAADVRTAADANRPARVVDQVLHEARERMRPAPIVTSDKLPAITIRTVRADVPPIALVVTIPRADPRSLAIAFEIAGRVCRAIADHPFSAWVNAEMPAIDVGRQNLCVTVTVACRHEHTARELAPHLDRFAGESGWSTDKRTQTHRVVRA